MRAMLCCSMAAEATAAPCQGEERQETGGRGRPVVPMQLELWLSFEKLLQHLQNRIQY